MRPTYVETDQLVLGSLYVRLVAHNCCPRDIQPQHTLVHLPKGRTRGDPPARPGSEPYLFRILESVSEKTPSQRFVDRDSPSLIKGYLA